MGRELFVLFFCYGYLAVPDETERQQSSSVLIYLSTFMNHFFLKTLVFFLLACYGSEANAYVTYNIDGINYIINRSDTTATVTYGSQDYKGAIVIPSSISWNGIIYKVTAIGDLAFAYDINLTSVYIPNSVKTIENSSFSSCTGLKTMSIPNSVVSIGESAFDGCNNLTTVTLSNTLTYIGERAFYNCI